MFNRPRKYLLPFVIAFASVLRADDVMDPPRPLELNKMLVESIELPGKREFTLKRFSIQDEVSRSQNVMKVVAARFAKKPELRSILLIETIQVDDVGVKLDYHSKVLSPDDLRSDTETPIGKQPRRAVSAWEMISSLLVQSSKDRYEDAEGDASGYCIVALSLYSDGKWIHSVSIDPWVKMAAKTKTSNFLLCMRHNFILLLLRPELNDSELSWCYEQMEISTVGALEMLLVDEARSYPGGIKAFLKKALPAKVKLSGQ